MIMRFNIRCYASGIAGRLSVMSVRDIEVLWSHVLEFFENNLMADWLTYGVHSADPNIMDLLQREHPKNQLEAINDFSRTWVS